MQFWIGVENFAKIEYARICINNYTVLVGPNNSGKTFLMQLVQGISKKLPYFMDSMVNEVLQYDNYGAYKKYVINSENVNDLIAYINRKIEKEKETIIREIFGKDIYAEKIYVDAVLNEETLYTMYVMDMTRRNEVSNLPSFIVGLPKHVVNIFNNMNEGIASIINKTSLDESEKTLSIYWMSGSEESGVFSNFLEVVLKGNSLFLPASRTGLLLLYRDFFANKTDKELSFSVSEVGVVEKQEKSTSLTKPMYEFLRFLQTYSEGEERCKEYEDELKFFEKYLIEGHIRLNEQDGFSYSSLQEENSVPMYLASSMIKEIAPIALAVRSQNRYNRLLIDEVEASLHPQKQLELVRFLNRLNNKGIQLILSTHSDTFAAKLSNLYVLSEKVRVKGEEVLEGFDLTLDDLINPANLYVYEFVIQKNGRSIVKLIRGDEKTGFEFDAFTDSAMHLYQEGKKIGEIQ